MSLQRLHNEVPQLDDPSATDYEKLRAIRLWSMKTLQFTGDATIENNVSSVQSRLRRWLTKTFPFVGGTAIANGAGSVGDALELLDDRLVSFNQLEMNIFFAQLCSWVGFPAIVAEYHYDPQTDSTVPTEGLNHLSPTPASPRHHLCLVRIDVLGEERVVLQDPNLNLGLLDHNNLPADWSSLTRDVLVGDHKKYKADIETAGMRPHLQADGTIELQLVRAILPAWSNWMSQSIGSYDPLNMLRFPSRITHRNGQQDGLEEQFLVVRDATVDRGQLHSGLSVREKLDREIREAKTENFYFASSQDRFLQEAKAYSDSEIGDLLRFDPWERNRITNMLELDQGDAELTSYPLDVCLPIADICNARCTFCTSWLEGKKILKIEQLDGFKPVIQHAQAIGLAGHGEPLSHPKLPAILSRLRDWVDPRTLCYVITNGVYLYKNLEALIEARVVSYAFSLNAASAETHETVMGLAPGSFATILDGIRALIQTRDAKPHLGITVSISLVLTQDNIHEAGAIVRLGNELGVDKVQLKTIAGAGGEIPGLNYHRLPPYLHPDFETHKADALQAISDSAIEVQCSLDSWETPVFPKEVAEQFEVSPPKFVQRTEALKSKEVRDFYQAQEKYLTPTTGRLLSRVEDFDGHNPYNRSPRYACDAPYRNLYLNDFSFSMVPCCYMSHVPGHEPVIYDGTSDFFEAWNSEAMQTLRRRLKEGPFFNMCTKCPTEY